ERSKGPLPDSKNQGGAPCSGGQTAKGTGEARRPRLSASGAELLLADRNDLHDPHLPVVDRLVRVDDDPVVALDEDLVAALDLLGGQRTAFFLDALEAAARGVAGDEPAGDGAAQAAGLHARELLLGAVIAQQAQTLEGLAGPAALAADGLLDEPAVHDPLAL